MNYVLHLGILLELYLILALSLNLTVGYAGLLSLSHAAFYGIGAYTAALLMTRHGLDFFSATILAVIITVLSSLIVSWASVRFRGDYFVLASLAFQVIVFSVLYNLTDLTGGAFGVSGIPKPVVAGIKIDSLFFFFIFGLITAVLVACFLAVIYRSPFCRSLKAVRDNDLAAVSLGKNVTSLKVRSICVASGCAALAGALYSSYVTYIDPTSFHTEESILLLSMVIIGGTGNFWGPIAGVVCLLLFPELLKLLAVPESIAANSRMIFYGLLLILVMRFRPQGIIGEYRFN
jgi:branched-chain amino acid transport system permease protein